MELVLIAAVAENGVIGKEGKLIWELNKDIRRFRKLTFGHPIIIGRRTYEFLPENRRPLIGRTNIVLSRGNLELKNVYVCHSLDEAIVEAQKHDNVAYIIGGSQIYKQALERTEEPVVSGMELTELRIKPDGDTLFPQFNRDEWNRTLISQESENGIYFEFVSYSRK
jgi:dihydrofolate reductase